MRGWIVWIVIIAATLSRVAAQQTRTWRGVVTDAAAGGPLAGAVVTACDAEGRLTGHAVTNARGEWSLVTKTIPRIFECSMLGYASQRIAAGDPAAIREVALVPQPTEIREVVVQAPRVSLRGDTVAYNVAAFAGAQDKSIADVLRRMPGVEVSDNGEVSYNGEPINRFYIEGNDMLGRRYGLASNNLPHQDVASVEIMENHQPVKALRDVIPSAKAAINLRLREEARARWTGSLRGGLGVSPMLWNAGLFAMRIGHDRQSMLNLRSDNTGERPGDDLNAFSLDDVFNSFPEYDPGRHVAAGVSSAPLDERRTRFNRTHALSSTDMWKLSEDYRLTAAVHFLDERLTSDYASETHWFLDGGELVTSEREQAMTHAYDLSARIELTANTDRFYLKDRLTADLEWLRSETGLSGSYPSHQTTDQPRRRMSNEWQWVRRAGRCTLTASSRLGWLSSPEELVVVRDGGTQRQTIASSAFHTDENLSCVTGVGRWKLTFGGGVRLLAREFGSSLSGAEELPAPLANDFSAGYVQPYVQPSVMWEHVALRLTVALPVDYAWHWRRDRPDGGSRPGGIAGFRPRVALRWMLSPRTTLTAGGQIGWRGVDEERLFEGALLRNYRYAERGTVNYGSDFVRTLSFGTSYRDPIGSVFANLAVGHTWSRNFLMISQRFEGDYVLLERIAAPNDGRSWWLKGGLSKGIDAMQGVAAVEVSWSGAATERLQEGVPTAYRTTLLQVSPRIDLHPARWCRIEYGFNWRRSAMRPAGSAVSVRDHYDQRMKVSITPWEGVSVVLTGEHYYAQLSPERHKHLVLADAAAVWGPRGKRWELTLSATNLFDGCEYAYTLFSDLNTVSSRYAIRPRALRAGFYCRF